VPSEALYLRKRHCQGGTLINQGQADENGIFSFLKKQVLLNARMLKYGGVGCAGIATNLGTMALLLTLGFQKGWMASAIAGLVSTAINFVLHNLWTFSDRQHQGQRLVRGFVFFGLVSGLTIGLTTMFYVLFTRIATRLTLVESHPSKLGIPLACQFLAILLGATFSYVLNQQFTWPKARTNPSANAAQVEEI
jgi:putative flippase GtrA